MSGYYDELLEEISRMTEAGELQNALFQIEKELKMPYVPADIEEKLLAMKRELAYRISEKKESSEWPLEKILRMLKGNDASQLAAASRLASRNLRECTEEIRESIFSTFPEVARQYGIEVFTTWGLNDVVSWLHGEEASLVDADCDLKPFTMKYIEAFSGKYDREKRMGGNRDAD